MKIRNTRGKKTARFLAALLSLSVLLPSCAPFVSLARSTDRENFFSVTSSELTKLGLSVLNINTDNGDYITTRLEYVGATMKIDLSEEFSETKNEYTEEALDIQIKGRGNSTWNNGYQDGRTGSLAGDTQTRKVPYNIKLSFKSNLFGLGKSKSWVLLANNMDKSALRNKLIYDLSARTGMLYTKSVYVNLMLNGEYMGIYMLCQKIDADLFGGSVTDWDEIAEDFADALAAELGKDDRWARTYKNKLCENLDWITTGEYKGYKVSDYIDISGISPYSGYLIEYDGYNRSDERGFVTGHDVPLRITTMNYIRSNDTLFEYVTDYFEDFEEALYSDTFYNSEGKHYSEYVDMDSFVDYYILNALMLNVEFGYKSMYLCMNSEGRLVFGPCWDYDWSSGNPFLNSNGQYDRWYNDGRDGSNHWYHQVYNDPWFTELVKERWFAMLDGINDMIDSMSYYYDYLAPTMALEYEKLSGDPYEKDFAWRTGGRSFEDECGQLKTFLENRRDWMTEQLSKRDPDIQERGLKSDSGITITLTGNGTAPGQPGCDYTVTKAADLTVSVSCDKREALLVLVNGAEYKSASSSAGGKYTFTLKKEALLPGVNVIEVLRNVGSDGFGASYISLKLPGEKRAGVTVGRIYPSDYAISTGYVMPSGGVQKPAGEPLYIQASSPAGVSRVLVIISSLAIALCGICSAVYIVYTAARRRGSGCVSKSK